jgi:antitoxin (DNA-binding transcriptional repressor) of toxin-antitoxin stability system
MTSQVSDSPVITAYSAWGDDVRIVPAQTRRDWMDATYKGFAYRCLPMLMANQSGWFVLAPHAVSAEWNGGCSPRDIRLEVADGIGPIRAESAVGNGILTWTIPYVFRTTEGWNLLCRGPANHVKDGIFPLEGLIETDWSTASFSMNWKFTRPGRCEFAAGEPVAMLVPHRRGDLEQFRSRVVPLDENPTLLAGYHEWITSRQQFLEAQRQGDQDALRQRYQRHYFQGMTVDGTVSPNHQKSRALQPFISPPEGYQVER